MLEVVEFDAKRMVAIAIAIAIAVAIADGWELVEVGVMVVQLMAWPRLPSTYRR